MPSILTRPSGGGSPTPTPSGNPFSVETLNSGSNYIVDERGDAIQTASNGSAAWDVEATGKVRIDVFYGAILLIKSGTGKSFGFAESADVPSAYGGRGGVSACGIELTNTSLVRSIENNTVIATIDNPSLRYESTYAVEVTPTSYGGDGLVRMYVDDTLLYTSSQVMATAVPFIAEGSSRGNSLTKVYVTYF